MGMVRALPPRGGTSTLARPIPPPVMQAFEEADEQFLQADWHVVYKGLTPGIYPAW
jgi:hypothetical protein